MSEPLDSRQLNAFVMLAKNGSYTRTAKQLFLTHSAISHAMRSLERHAGCRLLSRMGKKVILTDAGEALLQHAERVLKEMREARQTLNGLNKWGFRRLRLAAHAALGQQLLTGVLTGFHQEFPRVLMSVELLGCCDAPALLEANRVDLVFAEKPPPDDRFEFIPLFADRLHLVVNASHPWAAKESVPRNELPKQSFILYRTSCQTRRMLEAYFANSGIVLNIAVETDDLNIVKDFVKHTPIMSLLPSWAIGRELKEGSLVALSPGRKRLDQTWGFAHWRGHPLNHIESAFLKLCGKSVAALA